MKEGDSGSNPVKPAHEPAGEDSLPSAGNEPLSQDPEPGSQVPDPGEEEAGGLSPRPPEPSNPLDSESDPTSRKTELSDAGAEKTRLPPGLRAGVRQAKEVVQKVREEDARDEQTNADAEASGHPLDGRSLDEVFSKTSEAIPLSPQTVRELAEVLREKRIARINWTSDLVFPLLLWTIRRHEWFANLDEGLLLRMERYPDIETCDDLLSCDAEGGLAYLGRQRLLCLRLWEEKDDRVLKLLSLAKPGQSLVRQALSSSDCYVLFCLRPGLLRSPTGDAEGEYPRRVDVDVFRPLAEAYARVVELSHHQIDTMVAELEQLSKETTWRTHPGDFYARIDAGYKEKALDQAIEKLREETDPQKAKSSEALGRIREFLLEPQGLHRYLIFMAAMLPRLDARGQLEVAKWLMKGVSESVTKRLDRIGKDGEPRTEVVTEECPIFERFSREADQMRNELELRERATDMDSGTSIGFVHPSLASHADNEIRSVASGFYHDMMDRLCSSPLLYDESEAVSEAVIEAIADYLLRQGDRGRRLALLRNLLLVGLNPTLDAAGVKRFATVLKRIVRAWPQTCEDLLASLIDNSRSDEMWSAFFRAHENTGAGASGFIAPGSADPELILRLVRQLDGPGVGIDRERWYRDVLRQGRKKQSRLVSNRLWKDRRRKGLESILAEAQSLLGNLDVEESLQLSQEQVLGARLFIIGVLDATRKEARERSRGRGADQLPITEHLKDPNRQRNLIEYLLSEPVYEYLTNLLHYEQLYFEDEGPWRQIFVWSVMIRFRRLDRLAGDEDLDRGLVYLDRVVLDLVEEDFHTMPAGSMGILEIGGYREFIYRKLPPLLPALLLGEWFVALEGIEGVHRRQSALTERGAALVQTCHELLDRPRRLGLADHLTTEAGILDGFCSTQKGDSNELPDQAFRLWYAKGKQLRRLARRLKTGSNG